MTDILLSIHPQHAEAILDGRKTIEVRKVMPVRIWPREKIYLYATSPIKSVVGEVRLDCFITYYSDLNFNKNKYILNKACITEEEFNSYMGSREEVVLWCLVNPVRFKEPINLDRFKIKHPPQSFRYLKEVADE